MKKDYKFSIIVPIYNVGKYLEETIMSVVNQTIGFENIQLILINDGSIDNSEEICLKYQKIYPENIIYYKHFGLLQQVLTFRGISWVWRILKKQLLVIP